MKYLCGCEAPGEPRNMGRGAARMRRLDVYFGRKCLACALQANEKYVASLSNEDKDAILARINEKTMQSYW